MSDVRLNEDEGGGGAECSATSNVTTPVKNPVYPMHKVARRKRKKDLEEAVTEIVEKVIQEAYQNTFANKMALKKRLGQFSAKPTWGSGPSTNSNIARVRPVGGNPRLKVYYNVPFAEKDSAKASGLRWDPEEKKWYATRHDPIISKRWKIAKIYNPDADLLDEQLEIPNEKDSLNKRRHTMPQLTDFDAFNSDLKDNDIEISQPKLTTATQLTPTQSNFNEEKVDRMIADKVWKNKPIIISKDGYVIDGHHRWLAAVKTSEKINARTVDLEAADLLDFLKDKSYIEKKTINQ